MRTLSGPAAVLVAAGLIWKADDNAGVVVAAASEQLDKYDAMAQRLELSRVVSGDLSPVLPLLDQARTLSHWRDDRRGASINPPGLSPNAVLEAAGDGIYVRTLNRVFLPRLMLGLETQIRANLDRPEILLAITKVYLALGGVGPLDHDMIRQWMVVDSLARYAGAAQARLRTSLLGHLETAMAVGFEQVDLDTFLVGQARAAINAQNTPQRLYDQIRQATDPDVAPWTPFGVIGALGQSVMDRPSGKALTSGVPGVFTPAGAKMMISQLHANEAAMMQEAWVRGPTTQEALDASGRDILALYAADYIAAWDRMLGDLRIMRWDSLSQAAQTLYVLASPHSPMRILLAAMASQVTFADPPTDAMDMSWQPIARAITPHFQGLIGLLDEHALDPVFSQLMDLQQQLARLASGGNGPVAPALVSPAPVAALRLTASRQPTPLNGWLNDIAGSAETLIRARAQKPNSP